MKLSQSDFLAKRAAYLEKMRINKILLINPPIEGKALSRANVYSFPLGLTYIASYLSAHGYPVEILDCYNISKEDIRKTVRYSKPSLVDVSIPFTRHLKNAIKVSAIVKEVDGDILTVAGGVHVSAMPNSIGAEIFDYLVMGEGEKTLFALVEAINSGKAVSLPGVIDRHSAAGSSSPSDFIEDLNLLPFPQYDSLPLKKYWRGRKRWVNMITSRGCPFNCNFCSIHSVMGYRLRLRSVDNIIGEIEQIKSKFNIEEIFFEDDNLTGDLGRAKGLFREICRRDFKITFHCRNGIRADCVDEELFKLMKEAGFKSVWFAPESGSQYILDTVIKKNLRLEEVERAIVLAKQAGLIVGCFLVIGFPEETKEDIYRTIAYGHKLRKLGCNFIGIHCATPYPGTALFDQCISLGILKKGHINFEQLSSTSAVIHNNYFTAEELRQIRNKAEVDLNPYLDSWHSLFLALSKMFRYLFFDPVYLFKKIILKLKHKFFPEKVKSI